VIRYSFLFLIVLFSLIFSTRTVCSEQAPDRSTANHWRLSEEFTAAWHSGEFSLALAAKEPPEMRLRKLDAAFENYCADHGGSVIGSFLDQLIRKEFFSAASVIVGDRELPLLQDCIGAAATFSGVKKPLVALVDKKSINAHAVRNPFADKNFLDIHAQAVIDLSDGEFEALLYHEMAHLRYAHEVWLRAYIGASGLGLSIAAGSAMRDVWRRGRVCVAECKGPVRITQVVFNKSFMPIAARSALWLAGLGAAGTLCVYSYYFLRRQTEYEADLFAASALKKLAGVEQIKAAIMFSRRMEKEDPSTSLFSTHPSDIERTRALEDYYRYSVDDAFRRWRKESWLLIAEP